MEPHWWAERHRYPTRALPRTGEIVVVGAGLAGLATAVELARSGRKVVVVDRECVAAGASGRNGGLVLPGLGGRYDEWAERLGPQEARALHAAHDQGARRLVRWIEQRLPDCRWRAEGALHVAASEHEASLLAGCAVLLARDHFNAAWLDAGEIGRWIDRTASGGNGSAALHGALYLPHGGALHSGLLLTGLASWATDLGVTLVEEAEVQAVTEGPHGAEVIVGPSRTSADAVVLATNAWLPQVVPALGKAITPVRGQVLATVPLPPGRLRGAWSYNEGYEYAQQLPDGRVVAGGMRWTAPDREVGHAEAVVVDEIQARLVDWLGRLLQTEEIAVEAAWAGIMAWTPDRLPVVGRVSQRHWVAGGFNGHGVPGAVMAGRLLRSLMNQEGRPAVARFLRPGRFQEGGTRPWEGSL